MDTVLENAQLGLGLALFKRQLAELVKYREIYKKGAISSGDKKSASSFQTQSTTGAFLLIKHGLLKT